MDHPRLLLTALLLLLTLGYAGACAYWPFKNCRRCSGTGKLRSPTGRAYRRCPRCRSTGMGLRTGRRLYQWWRRIHHTGTRTDPRDR